MAWCPLMNNECRSDCTWYVVGECSVIRLNEIANQLDFLQDAVNALEETIQKKNFMEI